MSVSNSSETEDDEDILVEGFKKDLDALRQACRLYDYNSSDEVSDDADPDDDDELLLSIQKRFGVSSTTPLEMYEEEDDDEILRAVQQRFSSVNHLESKKVVTSTAKVSKIYCQELEEEDESCTAGIGSGKGGTNFLETIPSKGTSGSEICCDISPGCDGSSSPALSENKEADGKAGFTLPGQVELFDDSIADLSDEPVEGIQQGGNWIAGLSDEPLTGSTRSTLDALKKNRLCQKVLRSKLVQLQSKLNENVELKKQLKTLLTFGKICKRTSTSLREHDTNPAAELFYREKGHLHRPVRGSSQNRRGPPDNADVAKLRAMQKKFHVPFEPRKWWREERRELVRGVSQQIQESRIRSALEACNACSNMDEITFLDEQIRAVAKKSLTPADIQAALPRINWKEVARLYVVGRSPEECKIRWSNYEDPLVEYGPWTNMEDKRLWSIARQHNLCNWDLICEKLGTRRTIAQCLIRYQRSLNVSIMRSSWTESEDEQLRVAVELYGDQDWSTVAASLEGRTGSQCWNRWHKILHPMRQKSGRWNIMEDKRLKLAVSLYGPRMWKMIATHVPGRTKVQCRERWCNVLNPSLELGEWTEEEDKRLEEAVIKHGQHRWSAVANDLKPRTDNQCWRRWKQLHPEHVMAFQKDVHIHKVALMGNFVGRRKERPRLSPSDFVPEPGACSDTSAAVPKTRKLDRGSKSKRPGKKPRIESADDAAIRELYYITRRVTPEYSKIRRNERILKMKSARASGRMPYWKRSTEQNFGALGNMETTEICSGGSKPADSVTQNYDGTAAFSRLIHEVACLCHLDHGLDIGVKSNTLRNHNHSCSSMVPLESVPEGQLKSGTHPVHFNSDAAITDQDSTSARDDEVKAAMEAILSWPFFLGLQEIWRKQHDKI